MFKTFSLGNSNSHDFNDDDCSLFLTIGNNARARSNNQKKKEI